MTTKRRTFPRSLRRAVCKTSDGRPDLGTWLNRVRNLNDPDLTAAAEGIWCGRSGDARIDMPGTTSMLVVQWHETRVETAYIS